MIRAVWLAFWGELNTPGAFKDDPYGALTNQAGHLCIGAFLVSAYCLAYAGIVGEMPYRVWTWLLVSAGYLFLVEYIGQGWGEVDSAIDGGFVSLGAAAPLAALKEVSFHPKVVLEPQPESGLAVLAVIVVALSAYVYPRALGKWRMSRSARNDSSSIQ